MYNPEALGFWWSVLGLLLIASVLLFLHSLIMLWVPTLDVWIFSLGISADLKVERLWNHRERKVGKYGWLGCKTYLKRRDGSTLELDTPTKLYFRYEKAKKRLDSYRQALAELKETAKTFVPAACILASLAVGFHWGWSNVDNRWTQEEAREKEVGYVFYAQTGRQVHVIDWNGDLQSIKLDAAPKMREILIVSNDARDYKHPQQSYTMVRSESVIRRPTFVHYTFRP